MIKYSGKNVDLECLMIWKKYSCVLITDPYHAAVILSTEREMHLNKNTHTYI